MKSPIFLFSSPRSGSTLLQRVLMTHEEIASVAEPWIMLPFSYAFRNEGTLAEYGNYGSYRALGDFIENLPDKENDYYEALGVFANSLYEKQCLNDEEYFLDKTPRYYHIIPEISKAFPSAKFIFLFRNPVNVMSSMIQTWADGRLKKMYNYERDLNYGPVALSNGYKLLKDKAYALKYEDFVKKPNEYTKEICRYLDINFDENMLNSFVDQDTRGQMGDPTGIKEYKKIDVNSTEKWKTTFNTRFRKKYIKKYIQSIDEKTLEIQGYSKQNILMDIEKLQVKDKKYLRDKCDLFYSNLIQLFKPNIWFSNNTKYWAKNRFLS